MNRIASTILWLAVALAGAWAYGTLALHRGEAINSIYLLIAALCTYTIGYRFYSKWLAARVLMLNDRRATPCVVNDDGKDFVKTNKWIVFGHHFAAISGPGPLVGPVLAAQFGYLPGTLWILIGVVLGGAVQDFVILFCSIRRNGKSLGQMVREELNPTAGFIALVAILAIIVILLAVLGLVVVRALAESPWGVFTVGATIPIAMLMGGYLRFVRVGKVMEASVMGVILLLLAVWGGQFVYQQSLLHVPWASAFELSQSTVAWSIIGYGLAASVLPVWLLLAPRDYLSTFMKLGTIFALALGVFMVLPMLKMPAVTKFIDGSGLVVPGKLFPFCFITIACGSISGFHTLIASGTTPKIITREGYARPIGYGAMCLESLVAIMAMVAACTLEPGVYLGMNTKGAGATPAAIVTDTLAKVNATGFTLTAEEMTRLAGEVEEKSLYGRIGGAATLAVGMAQIFGKVTHNRWLGLWYHFAIMFEALFILTTLDAGTRVGRYLLQDLLRSVWKPLGNTGHVGANLFASALMVAGWGYFLIQGVHDPLGGINSLWPLFGIANQLLAAIALCLATTIILKMQLQKPGATSPGSPAGPARPGRPILALVTLLPLLWLMCVTMTAGYQKIYAADKRIGFLAAVEDLNLKLPALKTALATVTAAQNLEAIKAAKTAVQVNRVQHFNNLLDVVVAAFFLFMVATIFLISAWEWFALLARKKWADLKETAPEWLPEYAVAESKPLRAASLVALILALARELSGEAHLERAQQLTLNCECHPVSGAPGSFKIDLLNGGRVGERHPTREEAYLEMTEKRFKGVNRCC